MKRQKDNREIIVIEKGRKVREEKGEVGVKENEGKRFGRGERGNKVKEGT